MTNTTVPREEWPAWAKALVVAMTLLAVISIMPWVFMTSAMAGICARMMGNMQQMIEMMR
jgi:hypothetical protein